MKNAATFYFVEGANGKEDLCLPRADVTLKTLGWKEGFTCWLRAGNGSKRELLWTTVPDDTMLSFVVTVWAADCNHFYVVHRPKGEPSPNTTPVASPHSSPVTRSSNRAKTSLADVGAISDRFKDMHFKTPDNHIDPFTQEELGPGQPELIQLFDGSKTFAVNGEYFLTFVKSQLADGIALTNIELRLDDYTMVLKTDLWVNCLLRKNNFQSEFLSLFIGMCTNLKTYQDRLKALHANNRLFTKIKIFLNDLMTMGSNESAQDRLSAQPDALYYVSSVYFSDEEINTVLDFPGGSGLTFRQMLEVQVGRKVDSAGTGTSRNYEIFSSHDLAPLVRDLFGIRKGFQEEVSFRKAAKGFEKSWRKSTKSCSR